MIQLKQVCKSYYGENNLPVKQVIDHISLDIRSGEFLILLGNNGSGKTTLLDLIHGELQPSSGAIFVNNQNINELSYYQKKTLTAKIYQDPNLTLSDNLTVAENFRLASLRYDAKRMRIGLNEKFKSTIVERLNNLSIKLEHKIDAPIKELSGGEKQIVSILMATFNNKNKILLLDEPTAYLDNNKSQVVMQLLSQLVNCEGHTIILVTHSLLLAREYGNRLLFMKNGCITKDYADDMKNKLTITEIALWFV
ncbi:MAG: ATP-binding cassette domain-containing protein [Phycisphaerales bacterium]|nr:ATP-binding cassette domain-containing protein [Phycisphaerales bacterium]